MKMFFVPIMLPYSLILCSCCARAHSIFSSVCSVCLCECACQNAALCMHTYVCLCSCLRVIFSYRWITNSPIQVLHISVSFVGWSFRWVDSTKIHTDKYYGTICSFGVHFWCNFSNDWFLHSVSSVNGVFYRFLIVRPFDLNERKDIKCNNFCLI